MVEEGLKRDVGDHRTEIWELCQKSYSNDRRYHSSLQSRFNRVLDIG